MEIFIKQLNLIQSTSRHFTILSLKIHFQSPITLSMNYTLNSRRYNTHQFIISNPHTLCNNYTMTLKHVYDIHLNSFNLIIFLSTITQKNHLCDWFVKRKNNNLKNANPFKWIPFISTNISNFTLTLLITLALS